VYTLATNGYSYTLTAMRQHTMPAAAQTACSNNMFVLCTSRQFCVSSRYVSWTTDTKVLRQSSL